MTEEKWDHKKYENIVREKEFRQRRRVCFITLGKNV